MELIVGSGILLFYLYGVHYLFQKVPRAIARRHHDFVIQVCPAWIIVLCTSFFIAFVLNEKLAVYLLFEGFVYFSFFITMGLLILYFIVRVVHPVLYERIVGKLRA